ncbi:MAG: hypothetical protein AUF65_01170 [Chloroflexi bacterium 13_1_20CM_50_12]|nr:MAG: hypothetical protein AUF65_01170 [Chloroflexi bacterium 13_1_20CM_50_12]
MAAIAKSGSPSLSTAIPPTTNSLSGLYAGEAIFSGDPCYIKTSDGKVYRSNGTAANAAAVVDGFAMADCPIGEALSLYWGVNMRYGAGLNPGTFAYLDTTAGGLSDAPTTGGTVPIGRVIDSTRIWVRKSY